MKDAHQWFIPLSVGEPEQRQQIHGNDRAVGVRDDKRNSTKRRIVARSPAFLSRL